MIGDAHRVPIYPIMPHIYRVTPVRRLQYRFEHYPSIAFRHRMSSRVCAHSTRYTYSLTLIDCFFGLPTRWNRAPPKDKAAFFFHFRFWPHARSKAHALEQNRAFPSCPSAVILHHLWRGIAKRPYRVPFRVKMSNHPRPLGRVFSAKPEKEKHSLLMTGDI